eukprot:TRINITY_DN57507_c0_g1_i1.p1 TRINITY_DN57507_c0_g1~~TRINITY_DN57507_c0_g1_i1.p1  ORF type:complete len:327 (-),score=51.64 TRINITY_DN57507_c0_g1_i1:395-1375(-)
MAALPGSSRACGDMGGQLLGLEQAFLALVQRAVMPLAGRLESMEAELRGLRGTIDGAAPLATAECGSFDGNQSCPTDCGTSSPRQSTAGRSVVVVSVGSSHTQVNVQPPSASSNSLLPLLFVRPLRSASTNLAQPMEPRPTTPRSSTSSSTSQSRAHSGSEAEPFQSQSRCEKNSATSPSTTGKNAPATDATVSASMSQMAASPRAVVAVGGVDRHEPPTEEANQFVADVTSATPELWPTDGKGSLETEGTPLTAAALAAVSPAVQKQMIGVKLYPLVHQHQPVLAPKITGMMLELSSSELLMLLRSSSRLKKKIVEAMKVLRAVP